MTKLSDTQAIMLSAAAQRADGNLLPLPGSLRGGAAVKVVGALLARGLAREEVTDRTTRADSALNTVWRNEDDGRAVLLRITPEGLAAIGVEPAPRRRARGGAGRRGGRLPLQRGHQLGRRAGGGPGAAEPAAPKKRGRPKKAAATPARRGARPRRARPATTPSRRS